MDHGPIGLKQVEICLIPRLERGFMVFPMIKKPVQRFRKEDKNVLSVNHKKRVMIIHINKVFNPKEQMPRHSFIL